MSEFISPFHEAPITPADFDAVYDNLTRLQWSGLATPKIEWQREGNMAVATFGYFEDATLFVHGYLDSGWHLPAIRKRDNEESIRLRGKLREEFLPMESMADQIQIPERQPWGTPVTIRIPLEIINPKGLQLLLDIEARQIARESVSRENVKGVPRQSTAEPGF